jgi:hypothetical protein
MVYTCEFSPRNYSFSKWRFLLKKNVKIKNMDSRSFLGFMALYKKITQKLTFFYLDAHWNSDLPLAEELRIITENWQRFIVMIDDFQVPFDKGYTYDDYGGENVLNVNYLNRTGIDFYIFFPGTSEQETGAKRGCVVLTSDKSIADELKEVSDLIFYPQQQTVGY